MEPLAGRPGANKMNPRPGRRRPRLPGADVAVTDERVEAQPATAATRHVCEHVRGAGRGRAIALAHQVLGCRRRGCPFGPDLDRDGSGEAQACWTGGPGKTGRALT